MSKDPVPEWFGKGEAEAEARPRTGAEARSQVGCAVPIALLVLVSAGVAGAFFATRSPAPKSSTRATATVAPEPESVPLAPPPPTPPPPAPDEPVAPAPEVATAAEEVAPSPTPSIAVTDGVERLSAAKIQVVINQNRGRFRACYENALNYAPTAEGTVRLTLKINPTGRVESVSATQSGSLPPQVATCMSAITRTLRFPGSPEATTVTYPFVFSAN